MRGYRLSFLLAGLLYVIAMWNLIVDKNDKRKNGKENALWALVIGATALTIVGIREYKK